MPTIAVEVSQYLQDWIDEVRGKMTRAEFIREFLETVQQSSGTAAEVRARARASHDYDLPAWERELIERQHLRVSPHPAPDISPENDNEQHKYEQGLDDAMCGVGPVAFGGGATSLRERQLYTIGYWDGLHGPPFASR